MCAHLKHHCTVNIFDPAFNILSAYGGTIAAVSGPVGMELPEWASASDAITATLIDTVTMIGCGVRGARCCERRRLVTSLLPTQEQAKEQPDRLDGNRGREHRSAQRSVELFQPERRDKRRADAHLPAEPHGALARFAPRDPALFWRELLPANTLECLPCFLSPQYEYGCFDSHWSGGQCTNRIPKRRVFGRTFGGQCITWAPYTLHCGSTQRCIANCR
jgi:hypothetical protein